MSGTVSGSTCREMVPVPIIAVPEQKKDFAEKYTPNPQKLKEISIKILMKKLNKNFFILPHLLEEEYGDMLSPSEKYFVVMLFKLENRFTKDNGSFWHTDKKFVSKDSGNVFGFETYGFSASFCKRTRKKLQALDIIEIKYGWNKLGHRAGTYYRIKHEKFGGVPETEMNSASPVKDSLWFLDQSPL